VFFRREEFNQNIRIFDYLNPLSLIILDNRLSTQLNFQQSIVQNRMKYKNLPKHFAPVPDHADSLPAYRVVALHRCDRRQADEATIRL
jgi:hypothetical protein